MMKAFHFKEYTRSMIWKMNIQNNLMESILFFSHHKQRASGLQELIKISTSNQNILKFISKFLFPFRLQQCSSIVLDKVFLWVCSISWVFGLRKEICGGILQCNRFFFIIFTWYGTTIHLFWLYLMCIVCTCAPNVTHLRQKKYKKLNENEMDKQDEIKTIS